MIVTLTVNPSLDRTVELSHPLRPGGVQSAASMREDAGGKGLNVSRAVAAAGHATRAVLPLDPGDPFALVLRAAAVPYTAVPVRGIARANLTIVDADGVTTKINLPGTARTDDDLAALIEAVVAASQGAQWLVLAGSVPPGLGDGFYVEVIQAVRERVHPVPRIAVDASGGALRAAVEHGRPDLIKPNDEELMELTGAPLTSGDLPLADAVASAARELVPARVRAAFVTLGAAGAVLVTEAGAWHAAPPSIRVRSTVGAGDSSLAGFLLAETAGESAPECLRNGIRYGSAAAALPGTQAPTPADLLTDAVPVTALVRS